MRCWVIRVLAADDYVLHAALQQEGSSHKYSNRAVILVGQTGQHPFTSVSGSSSPQISVGHSVKSIGRHVTSRLVHWHVLQLSMTWTSLCNITSSPMLHDPV